MTAEEINRRVAEALGEKCYRIVERGRERFEWCQAWNPEDMPKALKWYESFEESLNPPVAPKGYCTDAAAADLVRQEIERRGWRWATGSDVLASFIENGMVYPMPHYANIWAEVPDWRKFGAAGASPHEALCLAFLAACEASKEVEK